MMKRVGVVIAVLASTAFVHTRAGAFVGGQSHIFALFQQSSPAAFITAQISGFKNFLITGEYHNPESPRCASVEKLLPDGTSLRDDGCGRQLQVEVDISLGTGRMFGTVPSRLGTITVDVTVVTDPTRIPFIGVGGYGEQCPGLMNARLERYGTASGTIVSSALGGASGPLGHGRGSLGDCYFAPTGPPV